MPSHLRLQSSFEPVEAQAIYHTSSPLRPAKKQKMSLTMTYSVASTARSKLGREASRADHNLRLLVGHANLLDTLMYDLANAEREQEAWFNQSVRKASKSEEPRRVQWVDTIQEEDFDEEDESDAEDEEELYEMFQMQLPSKISQAPVTVSSAEVDEDAEFDDEDYEDLALTRVSSKQELSPPELTLDSDEESDSEDDMPSSPENTVLELSEKQQQAITANAFYDIKSQQGLEDYVLQQPQTTIIAAC